jgi:hypothetical protein
MELTNLGAASALMALAEAAVIESTSVEIPNRAMPLTEELVPHQRPQECSESHDDTIVVDVPEVKEGRGRRKRRRGRRTYSLRR